MADEDEEPHYAGPVPQEALDYFRAKRLHPAFEPNTIWGQEHKYAFTVARIAEIDVLKKVRDSLDKAIEDGTPYAEWADGLSGTLDDSGWSAYNTPAQQPVRLATIYQTNMRMARANGQEDRAQRVKAVLPYFVYELGPSKVHREEHEEWEGITLPVDDPWWDSHAPPSAFGCKCRRRQITQAEADDNGGVDDSPDVDFEQVELPDGETTLVPEGVDPAFNYPKGSAGRARSLNDALDAAEDEE